MRYSDTNMYEQEERSFYRFRDLFTRQAFRFGLGHWFWYRLHDYVMRFGYDEWGYRNPHDWDCVDWTSGGGRFAGFYSAEWDSYRYFRLWRFTLTNSCEYGLFLTLRIGERKLHVRDFFRLRFWKRTLDHQRRKITLWYFFRVRSRMSRERVSELLHHLPF